MGTVVGRPKFPVVHWTGQSGRSQLRSHVFPASRHPMLPLRDCTTLGIRACRERQLLTHGHAVGSHCIFLYIWLPKPVIHRFSDSPPPVTRAPSAPTALPLTCCITCPKTENSITLWAWNSPAHSAALTTPSSNSPLIRSSAPSKKKGPPERPPKVIERNTG